MREVRSAAQVRWDGQNRRECLIISLPGNTDYAETPVSGKHPAQSRGRGAPAEEQRCDSPEAGKSLLFIPRNTQ